MSICPSHRPVYSKSMKEDAYLSLSLSSCLVRLQSCRVSSCWVTSSAQRQFTSSLSCSGLLQVQTHTHSQYAMQNTRKTQHCCLVSTAYNTQRLSLEGCRCVLTGAYRQWGHWARCSVSQRCENEKWTFFYWWTQSGYNIWNWWNQTEPSVLLVITELTRMQLKQQSLEQCGQRRASRSFSMQMKQRKTSAMLCKETDFFRQSNTFTKAAYRCQFTLCLSLTPYAELNESIVDLSLKAKCVFLPQCLYSKQECFLKACLIE